MSRRQACGQLPEAPGVGSELGVKLGRLPGTAVVPAQLNGTDPAGAGEGDAAELDRPRGQRGAIRGPIDARHGLDDRKLVPAVVLPVTRLVAGGKPDAGDPFGLLHPVMAGKQEAGWKAVLRGQGLSVEMGGE